MLTDAPSLSQWPDLHPASPPHRRRAEWVWLIVSAGFTAALIHYSFLHGRLAAPPFFDDVTYFDDALTRLQVLQHGGIWALIRGVFHNPPHSLFSTFAAMIGYLIFGIRQWAPYAINAAIILGAAGIINLLARGLPLWRRLAIFIFVLTIPISSRAVCEFRPDIASALCAAAGAVWLLSRRMAGRPRTHFAGAGALFGLALLIKTPTFPLTLAMCISSLVLAAVLELPLSRGRTAAREMGRGALRCLLTAILVALPAYVLQFRSIVEYIYAPVFGSTKEFWRTPGPLAFQLRYYFDGEGGRSMLGSHLYLLLAIAAAALLAALVCSRWELLVRLCCLLTVAAIAYAIPTLMSVKQPFFGTSFDWMLVLIAVYALAELSRRGGRILSGAILCIVVAAGLGLAQFVPAMYPISPGNSSDAIGRRRIADELYAALSRENIGRHTRIYITSTGNVNSTLLDFMFLQHGLPPMHIEQQPASDDLAVHAWEINHADYVIASESGNTEAMSWLPSGRIQDQTLALVRGNVHFQQVASVPTLNGRCYFVFRRVRSERSRPRRTSMFGALRPTVGIVGGTSAHQTLGRARPPRN